MKEWYKGKISDILKFGNKTSPEVMGFINTYLIPENKDRNKLIDNILIEKISDDGVSITIEKRSSSFITVYIYGQSQQQGRVDVEYKFGQNESYELETLKLSFSISQVVSESNLPIQAYTTKPNKGKSLTLSELRSYMHSDVYFAIEETYEAVAMLTDFITLNDIQRQQLLEKAGNRISCEDNVPHSSRDVKFALNLIKLYIEYDSEYIELRLDPESEALVTQSLLRNMDLIQKIAAAQNRNDQLNSG